MSENKAIANCRAEALVTYTDEKASLAHTAFLEERERHVERPEPKADEEEFRRPGDAS